MNRCQMTCPIGYMYCKDTKVCVPEQYGCSTSATKMPSTMLPSMNMANVTSDAVSVSAIGSDIFVVNRFSELDQYGVWQYNFDGKWNNLSSIPVESGVQLDSESSLRYYQHTSHYGLRHLYFYRGVMGQVGEVAKPQRGHSLEVVLMLIHPQPTRSTITVQPYSAAYVMNEDDPGTSGGIALSDLVTVDTPIADIKYDYYTLVPKAHKSAYEAAKREFSTYRPYVEIKQNFAGIGKLVLEEYSLSGITRKPAPAKISLDIEFATLVFVPHPDANGKFNLTMTFHDAAANLTSPVDAVIPVEVVSVNDRPTGKSAPLVPIPYNISGGYSGFTIDELIAKANARDAESQSVGVSIIDYSASQLGVWEVYSVVDAEWVALNLTKNDKKAATENALLASGDTRLRLKLDNENELWTRREARPYLRLRIWDGSDDKQEGESE